MTDGPSPHLSWAELACRDAHRTEYPRLWRVDRALTLATEFERIRARVGAIRIGSAYRTPTHNAAVGGSRESQHCEGRALDLYPPTGWTIERFYATIRACAAEKDSSLGGVGRYPTFVHIDVRPVAHGKLIVWHGKRAGAEVNRKGDT